MFKMLESCRARVARWHPRIPNRPQFGIQAACLVSTFFIWYPAKIWYPLRIDLVSNYKFGILGKQQLFIEKMNVLKFLMF